MDFFRKIIKKSNPTASNVPKPKSPPLSRRWTKLSAGIDIGSHVFVAVGDNLYAFGSTEEQYDEKTNNATIAVHSFNTVSREWKRIEASKNGTKVPPRLEHAVVAIGNLVYLWGGHCRVNEYCKDLFRFDTNTLEWTRLEARGIIPEGKYGHTAVAVQNRIYVFGGWRKSQSNDQLYTFDLKTETWSIIKSSNTPSARAWHSAAVVDDRFILIFGGENDFKYRENDLHIYDTHSNEWSTPRTTGQAPSCRVKHGAFVHNGHLYIIGGYQQSTLKREYSSQDIFRYNFVSRTWGEVLDVERIKTKMLGKIVCINGIVYMHTDTTYTNGIDHVSKGIYALELEADALLSSTNPKVQSVKSKKSHRNIQSLDSMAQNEYLIEYQLSMCSVMAQTKFISPTALQCHHEAVVQTVKQKHPHTKGSVYRQVMEALYQKFSVINKTKKDCASTAIGIDLGTTYCCIASCGDDAVELIQNGQGNDTTPSFVAFDDDGEPIPGQAGQDQGIVNPESTIYDVKRLLGRSFDSLPKGLWPFKLDDDGGRLAIRTNAGKLTPENVLTHLIKSLKKNAEDSLGENVVNVVVAVPVHFDAWQRYLIRDSLYDAGLNLLALISEPRAAIIGYNAGNLLNSGSPRDISGTINSLIFDLGGGTLDVATFKISKDGMEILAVDGNQNLGGQDFDVALMEYCITEFETKFKLSGVRNDLKPRKLRLLKLKCEEQKRYLSQAKSVEVDVEAFHLDKDLEIRVAREIFEVLIGPCLKTCERIVQRVLDKSHLAKVDEILLVGGSTRIPAVKNCLLNMPALQGSKFASMTSPDHEVAKGTAVFAHYLQKSALADNPLFCDADLDFEQE